MTESKPIKHNWRFKDISGQRFGRLTAIENVPSQYKSKSFRGATMWRCVCDCSEVRIVSYSNLKLGMTTSCGCLRRDSGAQWWTHRMSRTPEYNAWIHAKDRCFNPKNRRYADWGGRGITMCQEWVASFESFYAHIGPRPTGSTLDRIDNDGNYEPGNVRWSAQLVQNNNRRKRRYQRKPKVG